MARRKTTVYVDEELLKATKIRAAREDKRESDVVEDALRAHLGHGLLERIWEHTDLEPDEALQASYRELHAARRARRRTRRG